MVRTLQDTDCEAFVALRRKALLDSPLAFASSPSDDKAASIETVRERLRRSPDWVILGAFRPILIGVVGLYRDTHVKTCHKMHLWGMYVAPDHRCQGVASQLLQAAVDHARRLSDVSWIHLSVSSAATEAQHLYERAGFQVWGSEPESLRYEDRTVDEHHMALRLK
jgi:ribosomal protein S18 acetylase RimI-like enzyme